MSSYFVREVSNMGLMYLREAAPLLGMSVEALSKRVQRMSGSTFRVEVQGRSVEIGAVQDPAGKWQVEVPAGLTSPPGPLPLAGRGNDGNFADVQDGQMDGQGRCPGDRVSEDMEVLRAELERARMENQALRLDVAALSKTNEQFQALITEMFTKSLEVQERLAARALPAPEPAPQERRFLWWRW